MAQHFRHFKGAKQDSSSILSKLKQSYNVTTGPAASVQRIAKELLGIVNVLFISNLSDEVDEIILARVFA